MLLNADLTDYSEAYYVLELLPEEAKSKIPTNIMNILRYNRETFFEVKEDMKFSDNAIGIIRAIYIAYLCSPEKRNTIILNDKKRYADIVNKKSANHTTIIMDSNECEDELVYGMPQSHVLVPDEIKKNPWQKFVEAIKNFFSKKKSST